MSTSPANKLPFREEKKSSEVSVDELAKTDGRKIMYMKGLLQAQAGGIHVQPPMPMPNNSNSNSVEGEETEG